MGTINHNAVIASTWNSDQLTNILRWIAGLPQKQQSLFLSGAGWANGEQTIVLIPDGSKEGWEESNEGDELRQAFIEQLQQDAYEDGSSSWRWIEVSYGEFGQKVLRGNNKEE